VEIISRAKLFVEMENLFHISPKKGLKVVEPGHGTVCSRYRKSTHVYLGTMDYLMNQYLHYCPAGTYYVYSVERPLELEKMTEGQWRTSKSVKVLGFVNEVIVRRGNHERSDY
jgi:hypothetical protein